MNTSGERNTYVVVPIVWVPVVAVDTLLVEVANIHQVTVGRKRWRYVYANSVCGDSTLIT